MPRRSLGSLSSPPPPKPSDRDQLRALSDCLAIDKDNLDDELVEHPELVWKVGRGVALAISVRDGQKEYLKTISGRIANEARKNLEKAGAKTTVAAVGEAVEEIEEWQKERKKYLELCHDVERWAALRDAFTARGYALHNFAGLSIARMRAEAGQSEFGPGENT